MHIIIAPDKMKGSLSAIEVAEALKLGFAAEFPNATFDLVPIADGGEGTLEAFLSMNGASRLESGASDSLGRPIRTCSVLLPEKATVVLEMSQAAGLARLETGERNPMKTSTAGVGDLLLSAVKHGAKTILVGLGGSSTNDAGCGMASRLGWKFLDSRERELPDASPASLQELHRIVPPEQDLLEGIDVVGLCDVNLTLLGPKGCSRVFSPQKGATPSMVETLEGILEQVASLTAAATRRNDLDKTPGAGAAGGLGFGLLAFAGGRLAPGFPSIAEALGLQERIHAADLVLTAEGSLDGQTLHGKGPGGLAEMARSAGKPVIAFAGALEDEESLTGQFDAWLSIQNGPLSLEESQNKAPELLTAAARRAARLLLTGKKL